MKKTNQEWASMKNGDKLALKKIYESHVEALLQYGLRFTTETTLVEDCIHDVFVYIWNKRATIGETDNVRGYLLLSLKHSIFKKIKKAKRTQSEEDFTNFSFEAEASIEEQLIHAEMDEEQKKQIQAAFQQLSAREREAIHLKFFQEKDYQEIAEIMNLKYQSVRNLIFRALTSLREKVQ